MVCGIPLATNPDLRLPAHHQTGWQSFLETRRATGESAGYAVGDPRLVVDTLRPVPELVSEVKAWIEIRR
jgi:hypothetical protein